MASPLLIILGAGKNVGAGVANKFKKEGFKVALGSRNPQKEEGFHTFQVDLAQPSTVSAVLEGVEKELGTRASVIVYNAASYTRPQTATDPLALPFDKFAHDVNVTSHSAIAAAQHAITSFRALPAEQSRAFIVTGNLLPFVHLPEFFSLAVGKTGIAHTIALAAKAYGSQGHRFYYATLVDETGAVPWKEFGTSGTVHGEIYYNIYKQAEQGDWDVRFTPSGKLWLTK
eukprot:Phypoly_transcript_12635.p1 GENE.Phypoly_transcript_12635~~Phypoly_transcript_12635.p1  ORF type:complete len:229 (+),score=50.70 Phypoly_transcript_12635:228-914(+)